jgi:hypothetical protein
LRAKASDHVKQTEKKYKQDFAAFQEAESEANKHQLRGQFRADLQTITGAEAENRRKLEEEKAEFLKHQRDEET